MDREAEEMEDAPRAGRVSAVEVQKKDATRVSVFIDGHFAFGLSAEVAFREGVTRGRDLSVEEQQRILATEHVDRARVTAFAYVAVRSRTREEVRRKLTRGGFAPEAVDSALARLEELGYVNDREYAERYASIRLGRRYGPRRVVQELLRRGIPQAMAEEAVTNARVEGEVERQAYEAAARRARRLSSETDERKRSKKLYDFLVRRGFDAHLALETIQALRENQWK